MAKTVTLTIDGTPVTVPEGTLLVEAAKTIATDVPVYCYHPKLGPAGLCRICLVEIEKMPKLQIACNTVVTEGMAVHTYGAKVEEGRRAVMEFLLVNHPLDCPICDKGGECDLQDYSMAYGQSSSRLADPKSQKPKAIDLGPTIVLDDERCIVCQRCSRFDEIITHERSLVVKDRGQRDVIATASGEPYRSNFSGNVTELCPVGALTSKTYRFKSRPWDNRRTETTCFACPVGCKQNVDVRHGTITRTMSVHDDDVSDGWLCDRGRYNIGYVDDARRVVSPMLRVGDDFVQIAWDDAIELVAGKLRDAIAASGPKSVAALGGGDLTNEENLLLAELLDGLGVGNRDWRAGRASQASPGSRAGTYADLENAQLIVAIGRPPSQTAPVMDLRIRKAVARHGASYVVVGDHAPGSFVPAHRVAHIADVAPLLAPSGGEPPQRIAFVWDGIDRAEGARAEELMEALAAKGATVHAFVTPEFANARGAEAFGIVPHVGALGSDAIVSAAAAGDVRVLILAGADPVLTHPAGATAVSDAIERADFTVATSAFLTQSARLANLVLPVRVPLEKAGHAVDLAGDTRVLRVAQHAPEGTLSEGDIIVALAAELDVTISAPDVLAARAATLPTSSFAFADGSLARDAVATTAPAAGDGVRVAIAASVFAGGGASYFDERFAPLRPQASVTVHPQTAGNALEPGAIVDLVAGDVRVPDLVVVFDEDAAPGVAFVIDGLPEAPANALRAGQYVRFDNVRIAQRELAGGVA
jgi:NADH-quinone oxidoreductase subunit G